MGNRQWILCDKLPITYYLLPITHFITDSSLLELEPGELSRYLQHFVSEDRMLLINFSHPISDAQRAQIETLTSQTITRLVDIPTQFDEQAPFAPQLATLMAQIDLTPAQWQGDPILVVLPSLNFIAAALLAELHGRMGYFPPVVRTRPVANALPRRYEVAEILDLQALREEARKAR